MKKIAAFVVCLLLMCLIAAPAFAAGETEISVTANASQVYRGDQIEVVVSISGSNSYDGLGASLSYDTSKFEYVAGSAKITDHLGAFVLGFDEGHEKLVLAFQNPTTYAGELMRFKLKVLSNSTFGDTNITVEATVTGASHVVKGSKVTVACKHNYETWTKVDDNNHTSTCTVCNTPTTTAHTWDAGSVTKGSDCDSPGEKTYTCTAKNCGAKKVEPVEKTGHAWDNACDTECNNGCGTTREITHKYADKFSSDEKGHWYACTVCGDKKDYYEHTPDRDEATEKEAKLCKYCGYVIADKLAHVHDVSPQIQKDAEGHWYYCSKLGCYTRIDLAAHVYDDECDVDCNVCAYIRIPPHQFMPEWRGGQEGHWQVCALCSAESEILPHTPGEPATQDNPQLCTDCLYWLQWPLSHVCVYGDAWEQDEDGHWQICTECQTHSEHQEHTWDEGTVTVQPTQTQEGTKTFTCTVCQAEKTESVSAVTPTDPTEPSEPARVPEAPVEEDGFPWWILAAAAGVLLVIGIVLLIIELIRSRKTNMHGKFSK